MLKAGIQRMTLDELELRRGVAQVEAEPTARASRRTSPATPPSVTLRTRPSRWPSRLLMSSSSNAPTVGSQIDDRQQRQSVQERYLQM